MLSTRRVKKAYYKFKAYIFYVVTKKHEEYITISITEVSSTFISCPTSFQISCLKLICPCTLVVTNHAEKNDFLPVQ